jgi:hypothetical protein
MTTTTTTARFALIVEKLDTVSEGCETQYRVHIRKSIPAGVDGPFTTPVVFDGGAYGDVARQHGFRIVGWPTVSGESLEYDLEAL